MFLDWCSKTTVISYKKIMKKQNITLTEQLQNPIEKLSKEANSIPINTQIHDRSLSWTGTGTSMKKSFRVKLV